MDYSVPPITGAPQPPAPLPLQGSGGERGSPGFSFPEPQSLAGGASTPPPTVARIPWLHAPRRALGDCLLLTCCGAGGGRPATGQLGAAPQQQAEAAA